MTVDRRSRNVARRSDVTEARMRKGCVKSLLLIAGLAIRRPSPSLAAGEARKTVPASAPRLALVIGNANYVKLGKLGNPGRDARLMAEKLQQLGFDVTEVADRDLKGMTARRRGVRRQDQGARAGDGVGAVLCRPRPRKRLRQLSGACQRRHQKARRRRAAVAQRQARRRPAVGGRQPAQHPDRRRLPR